MTTRSLDRTRYRWVLLISGVLVLVALVGIMSWNVFVYSPPDQEEPRTRAARAAIQGHLEDPDPGIEGRARPFCNVFVHRLRTDPSGSLAAISTYTCEYFLRRPDGRVVGESGGHEAGVFRIQVSGDTWTVVDEQIAAGVGFGFRDEIRRLFPSDLADEILSAGESRAWPSEDGLRDRAEAYFARE